MFCGIKRILSKTKISTCLMLRRSFGNVIHNIAPNSDVISENFRNVTRKEIEHY